MSQFLFSNDPLRESLSETGLVVGILAFIGIVVWGYFRSYRQQDMSTRKKAHSSSSSSTRSVIVIVLLSFIVFTRLYLYRITQVDDPAIQQQYADMYDYQRHTWTSL